MARPLLLLLLALPGCGSGGGSGSPPVTGGDPFLDASPRDARALDAAPPDARAFDAAPHDAAPDAAPRDAEPDAAHDPGVCPGTYGPPETTGHLADPELVETSGVVASRTSPGVLWMHNDSGDSARLFATGTDGRALGRLHLDGVDAVDIEDIAAGPCPDGHGPCLWVGDIGNNDDDRHELTVYVIPEPVVDPDHPFGERTSGPVRRLPFRYPGDPEDSEALMVAPDGSTFYVIEKTEAPQARVWRHPGPLVHDRSVTLVPVATLSSPGVAIPHGRMVTGADLHPTGTRLLVRVYTGTYEYRLALPNDLSELGSLAPITVALGPLTEMQGEAVAYDAAGAGLWTVSEDVRQKPGQPLHHYACRP